jgi:hypothetical protein
MSKKPTRGEQDAAELRLLRLQVSANHGAPAAFQLKPSRRGGKSRRNPDSTEFSLIPKMFDSSASLEEGVANPSWSA